MSIYLERVYLRKMKNNNNYNRLFFALFVTTIFMGTVTAQVRVFEKFDKLEEVYMSNLSSDTTYVINFWATWCAPCVKELPYFEELNAIYEGQPFSQVLVSLDDPKKIESKVIPFLKKNNIASEVVVLADGKANSWIDRVDPSWSGAIPITLILKGDEKLFYETEFHSVEELEEEVLLLFNKD